MEAQSRKDRPVDASEWALSQLAQGKTRRRLNNGGKNTGWRF